MSEEKKTQAECIIEGLQIILKYDPSGNVWHDLAEFLHAGSKFDADNITPEDNRQLLDLRWYPWYGGGWEFRTTI